MLVIGQLLNHVLEYNRNWGETLCESSDEKAAKLSFFDCLLEN